MRILMCFLSRRRRKREACLEEGDRVLLFLQETFVLQVLVVVRRGWSRRVQRCSLLQHRRQLVLKIAQVTACRGMGVKSTPGVAMGTHA